MIKPVSFGYNAETAVNNAFQVKNEDHNVQQKALQEFNDFVNILRSNGVDVTVVEDTPLPHTPDSIFPNNWVSFHHDGTLLLYPMYAANRRAERKEHVLTTIREKFAGKTQPILFRRYVARYRHRQSGYHGPIPYFPFLPGKYSFLHKHSGQFVC